MSRHEGRRVARKVARATKTMSRGPLVCIALIWLLASLLPMAHFGTDDQTEAREAPPLAEGPAGLEQTDLGTARRQGGFLQNLGQLDDPRVLYYTDTSYGRVAFLRSEVVHSILEDPSDGPIQGAGLSTSFAPIGGGSPTSNQRSCCVRSLFEGSSDVLPVARNQSTGLTNYLTGPDREGWVTGVPAFSEVVYEELYEGIDLVYHLWEGSLKYDFVLHPGSDPSMIRIHLDGLTALGIVNESALMISTPSGPLCDRGLRAYYMDDPTEGIGCGFEILGPERYGFVIGQYERTRSIVVDPILFSARFGGNSRDLVYAVATDPDMDVYITGSTSSSDFPTTLDAFDTWSHGYTDVFISKMSADGERLIYSTYIGGRYSEVAYAIAVDGEGNAYVTGRTGSSLDFPLTPGAFHQPGSGCFVCELNGEGTDLVFSTIFGGDSETEGDGIALGPGGDIFITGRTFSNNFPTTTGAYQTIRTSTFDVFVCKMRNDGSDFVYSTRIGGGEIAESNAIAVDKDGSAYITGRIYGWSYNNYPTTDDAYQSWYMDGSEAFVTKLNPNGTDLEFSTFLGSEDDDVGTDIAIDCEGNSYITGSAGWESFPTTPGSFQPSYGGGGSDCFVCKLNPDGSRVLYGTFLGGEGADEATGIELSDDGEVFLSGWTESGDFPNTTDAFQGSLGGNADAFLCKLDLDDSVLLYSSFLGGAAYDHAEGLAISRDEVAYVGGTTFSSDYPATPGAFNMTGGDGDCFLVKLNTDEEAPLADAGDDISIEQHQKAVLNGTRSTDNVVITTWRWRFIYDGQDISLEGETVPFTFHRAGIYVATLAVTDEMGHLSTDTVEVVVRDVTPPVAEAGADVVVEQHRSVGLDGRASTDNVGVTNWTWQFVLDGVTTVLYGPTATSIFDQAGVLTVSLVVSDAEGNRAMDEMNVTVLDITPPAADAGDDILINQHELATLDGSGSSDNTAVANWTWSFKDGDSPILVYGVTSEYRFDEPGTYLLRLVVEDARGNLAEDGLTVTVRDTTPPDADAGPDRVVDPHSKVKLDASGSRDNVGIVRWVFSFDYGGLEVQLTGLRPEFTFDLLGEVLLNLTVHDAAGNSDSDQSRMTVRDVTRPVAMAGPDRSVGQRQQLVLDATGSWDNVGIVRWVWSIHAAGAPDLSGPFARVSFERAGPYTVTLNVSDSSGNWGTDGFVVTVMDVTPPEAEAGPDQTADQGAIVSLNGTASRDDGGVVNWTWHLEHRGRQVVLFGPRPEFIFEESGDHVITLTVRDAAGNNASDMMLVKVNWPPTGRHETALGPVVAAAIILVLIAISGALLLRRRGTEGKK